MKKAILYWMAGLSIVAGAAKGQTTVYQSSFPTNQNWSDTFQYAPPSDGKFILSIDNPDATFDSGIALLDGTAWNTGQNLMFCPMINQGVQRSIFEMDVKASWGLRPWLWLSNQTPNVGYDTITLQFASGSVSDQPKSHLGTLTSGPMQANFGEWSFDLTGPGKLLFNVTHLGSGGGSHSVYVDNVKIMELRVGWASPPPEWSSIEVSAGHHTVRLAHEDDYWSDNSGTRETKVYLSTTTPPPQTVTIHGMVIDELAQQAFAGATVTTGNQQTLTGLDGKYEITGLPPGPISVTATCPGFKLSSQAPMPPYNVEPGKVLDVNFWLLPENPVVIPTDFIPSQYGFHFCNNWGIIGNCSGMSIGSLFFYKLEIKPTYNLGITATCEDEPPPPNNPERKYIELLQILYGLNLQNLSIKLSGFIDSWWIFSQYNEIKESLEAGVPCPIGLTGESLINHEVLAYKIVEYPIPSGTEHLIYVYNPNNPDDDDENILIRESNGVWSMVPYQGWQRFGALAPFTVSVIKNPINILMATDIFSIILHSPATLQVVDPDGLIIDQNHTEVDGGYYCLLDIDDDDGHREDVAFFLVPKYGTYTVEVIPDPSASPTETYGLEVISKGESIILAEDVPISDIPEQPYLIESSEAGVKAAPIAEAGGPYEGMLCNPITFDASGSYDPDGQIVLAEWDWDLDGTYDYQTNSPLCQHTWGYEFSGTVRLRVTDNEGLTSIDTAPVVVVAPSPEPVDDLVSISVGRASYDRRTGQFSVDAKVTNSSATVIGSPVWMVIESISNPAVTLAGADGTTIDGKAYVDLSGLLGNGQLDPAETISKRIYFNNPNRVQFTFKPSVRGVILP